MLLYQRTLSKSVSCSGVGVHSGKKVNIILKPAPVNHGIRFVRNDLMDSPSIAAHFNRVVDTSLATVIGFNGFIVSTIEHLMASFSGLSIDNAIVELDSYEMPIMDGSAGPFTRLIRSAGIVAQDTPRIFFRVKKPVQLKENGKCVEIHPCNTFKISCTIEFPQTLIGKQSYSIEISEEVFEREISTARTFGFLHEYEYLKKFGLGCGCSLDNVVVIDGPRILNSGGLRFEDEFVRHKILDFIGDFSLLGLPILGHIISTKSGHAFNYAFLEKFLKNKDAWETSAGIETRK